MKDETLLVHNIDTNRHRQSVQSTDDLHGVLRLFLHRP